MLQENNPDAACMHRINVYERGRRVQYRRIQIGNKQKENPSRIVTSCSRSQHFLPRLADFDFFMLVLANSVCLLALSRSDRHVRASLLCAWLIALCCAVVDARRQHATVVLRGS